jgi:hypothetical protein
VTTPPTELSIAEVSTWLSGLTRQLDRALAPEHRDAIGARLRAAAGGSRAPLGALMNLALLADCVSVAQLAIDADGVTDADELARAQPLIQIAARTYFQVLPAYEAYGEPELSHAELAAFLTAHRADVSAFGGARADWPGIALCREIATAASHAGLLREHERMLTRVMAAVFAGRAPDAEASARRRLRSPRSRTARRSTTAIRSTSRRSTPRRARCSTIRSSTRSRRSATSAATAGRCWCSAARAAARPT